MASKKKVSAKENNKLEDYVNKALTDIQNVTKSLPRNADTLESIDIESINLIRHSIRDVYNAYEMAKDNKYSDNIELLNVFESVELDPHVSSVVNTIHASICEMDFFIKDSSGEIDIDKTNLFKARWFNQFTGIVLDAKYWGYSGVQLGDVVDNKFKSIQSIPRENIRVKERGIVKRYSDNTVLLSFDDSPYDIWTILVTPDSVADRYGLGLYNKIAKLVMLKRDVIQFWSVYNELFGNPFRVIYTDVMNNRSRENAINANKSLRTASFAVLGTEDRLEFIETGSSSSSAGSKDGAFITFLNFVDEQISKLFLGSTMVVDNGSSRSQAEVHENNTRGFVSRASKFVASIINDDLIPRMIKIGFPLSEGDTFYWDDSEKLTIAEWANLFDVLNRSYRVPIEFVKYKLGIELEEKENSFQIPAQVEQQANASDGDTIISSSSNKLWDNITRFYKGILNR